MSTVNILVDDTEQNSQPAAKKNPLEQFLLLAKGTKGAACLDLIKHVLEAPGVYVFAELLEQPNIRELETTPHKKYLNTLNLFAYGTYKKYLENKEELIELTETMKRKLQHLTIVTMAIKNKCIAYRDLQDELDIKNVRDLEDLIIESIYSDIIHGKLDQRNKQLEVDNAIGRDIQAEDISKISKTLQEWCDSCESVLSSIESQIDRANIMKAAFNKHTDDVEQEITNLKKTIKTQLRESDDPMDYHESSGVLLNSSLQERNKRSKPKVMKPLSGDAKHR